MSPIAEAHFKALQKAHDNQESKRAEQIKNEAPKPEGKSLGSSGSNVTRLLLSEVT